MSAGIPGRAVFIIKNDRKDNKLLNSTVVEVRSFFVGYLIKNQNEKCKSAINLMPPGLREISDGEDFWTTKLIKFR